jgi:hypothetical protein
MILFSSKEHSSTHLGSSSTLPVLEVHALVGPNALAVDEVTKGFTEPEWKCRWTAMEVVNASKELGKHLPEDRKVENGIARVKDGGTDEGIEDDCEDERRLVCRLPALLDTGLNCLPDVFRKAGVGILTEEVGEGEEHGIQPGVIALSDIRGDGERL